MERDKDLFREILLKVEVDPRFNGTMRIVGCKELGIEHCSQEKFAYHCQLLHEAGFLEGNMKMANQGTVALGRLTFNGHEFLDTIREPEIWRVTKENAKKVGGAGLQMLFEIGKACIKQKLIEQGIRIG